MVTPAVGAGALGTLVLVGAFGSCWLAASERTRRWSTDLDRWLASLPDRTRRAYLRLRHWCSQWRWWQLNSLGRERRRRSDELGGFVAAVARGVRSGLWIDAALAEAGQACGGVLGDDMERVARRVRAGLPLLDSLHRWAHESASDDVALFVTSLEVSVPAGVGVAAALDGVAATLFDRNDAAAEARAQAAQATSSAWLLVALPGVVLVGSVLLDPTSARATFGTPIGLACLVAATVLDLMGAWWMRSLIQRVVR